MKVKSWTSTSTAKALKLLQKATEPINVAEIVRKSGSSKSVVYRLLAKIREQQK